MQFILLNILFYPQQTCNIKMNIVNFFVREVGQVMEKMVASMHAENFTGQAHMWDSFNNSGFVDNYNFHVITWIFFNIL